MKITGIIVEYNPFHNGHLHHLQETKRLSQCDILIAVMSGNFLQRGEPAIVNKHLRAQMALQCGVDLVVELPYSYAVQNADLFAFGAVYLLNELQVDDIYFGSETNQVNHLKKIAQFTDTEAFNKEVKKWLDHGYSYPSSCQNAINTCLGTDQPFNPNDLLGIQYIRSILNINPKIKFQSIKRIHSNYHDVEITHEEIASATSIRHALYENKLINPYVPHATQKLLFQQTHVFWDAFYPLLKYQINLKGKDLSNFHDVNEGFEHAILKHINETDTFNALVEQLTSKRYTKAKVQRVLTHILNDITKNDIDTNELKQGPKYIRILGINKDKSHVLQYIKTKTSLPLITNLTKEDLQRVEIDEKTSRVYHLVLNSEPKKIPEII